jgi:hypothetical protein
MDNNPEREERQRFNPEIYSRRGLVIASELPQRTLVNIANAFGVDIDGAL